jgi:hypothetical protein
MTRIRLTWKKEAASGNYGFTKATQNDVEVSIRKLTKRATAIAQELFSKDQESVPFLQTHFKATKDKAAKALLEGMRGIGPNIDPSTTEKLAAAPARGLYGFKAKTAARCIQACSNLVLAAGEIAYDLSTRRADRLADISGYLKHHCDAVGCAFSDLLGSSFTPTEEDATLEVEVNTPEEEAELPIDKDGKPSDPTPSDIKAPDVLDEDEDMDLEALSQEVEEDFAEEDESIESPEDDVDVDTEDEEDDLEDEEEFLKTASLPQPPTSVSGWLAWKPTLPRK